MSKVYTLSFVAMMLVLSCFSSKSVVAIEYGVDISFPMHHGNVSINYDSLPHNVLPTLYPMPHLYEDMPLQPLGNRQRLYNEFMEGCVHKFSKSSAACWEMEQDRIAMNLRQPQSMINYTETVSNTTL